MTHQEVMHVANQMASALNSVEAFSSAQVEETDLSGYGVRIAVQHDEHGEFTLDPMPVEKIEPEEEEEEGGGGGEES